MDFLMTPLWVFTFLIEFPEILKNVFLKVTKIQETKATIHKLPSNNPP